MGRPFKDLSGNTYGFLNVLKKAETTGKNARWECRCICGKITTVESRKLRTGKIKSCGCKRGILKIQSMGTHGKTNTRLYSMWHSMKSRCNYDTKGSERYYGRGIKVCSEWEHDFIAFHNWAVNNGYKDNLSIDRIDNNKGYSPDNCRWVDLDIQNNNRSTNKYLEIEGEEKTIAEWAKITGIKYETIRSRLARGITGKALIKRGE